MAKDKIVDAVIRKYQKRSLLGQSKYGTTMERDDLSELDWLNHFQCELMDASLYVEKLIQARK